MKSEITPSAPKQTYPYLAEIHYFDFHCIAVFTSLNQGTIVYRDDTSDDHHAFGTHIDNLIESEFTHLPAGFQVTLTQE